MTELTRALLTWHDGSARDLPWRLERDPYKIWLSEIMLQQTRAETVIGYYNAFLERFPTVEALAAADPEDVLKRWEGLGYYSRARNLLSAARMVVEMGGFPRDLKGLRALPGVGEYTAGAIASIALGLPEPAIDGNQIRVLSRLFGIRLPVASKEAKAALREAARSILPAERPGDFNQAMMGLGALVCVPAKPRCQACPVCLYCDARQKGDAGELPVLPPKIKKKVEQRAVLLVYCGGRVLVRRRPEEGLLAGLYEFPSFSGAHTRADVAACLLELGIADGQSLRRAGDARHVFTHLIWRMEGWEVETQSPGDGRFIRVEELETLPFPTAMKFFYARAIEALKGA